MGNVNLLNIFFLGLNLQSPPVPRPAVYVYLNVSPVLSLKYRYPHSSATSKSPDRKAASPLSNTSLTIFFSDSSLLTYPKNCLDGLVDIIFPTITPGSPAKNCAANDDNCTLYAIEQLVGQITSHSYFGQSLCFKIKRSVAILYNCRYIFKNIIIITKTTIDDCFVDKC